MYEMLKTAFGASCMNRASAFEWHKRFKKGRESGGMMRGVGGVRKSIHQSWLAKQLGFIIIIIIDNNNNNNNNNNNT